MYKILQILVSMYVTICCHTFAFAQSSTVFEWEAKETYILESLEIAYRKCSSNPLSLEDYQKLKPVLRRSIASRQTDLTATSARNKFMQHGQEYCSWSSNRFQTFAKELN